MANLSTDNLSFGDRSHMFAVLSMGSRCCATCNGFISSSIRAARAISTPASQWDLLVLVARLWRPWCSTLAHNPYRCRASLLMSPRTGRPGIWDAGPLEGFKCIRKQVVLGGGSPWRPWLSLSYSRLCQDHRSCNFVSGAARLGVHCSPYLTPGCFLWSRLCCAHGMYSPRSWLLAVCPMFWWPLSVHAA